MAIAKMRKLNLVALAYDKDALLNALQRTGAAEITFHEEVENTVIPQADAEETRAYRASAEAALSALSNAVENYEKANGVKSGLLKDGFEVSYSEFTSMKDKLAEADETVKAVNARTDERNELRAELAKIGRQREQAQIYAPLKVAFSAFGNTASTRGRLGVIPAASLGDFEKSLSQTELCAYEVLNVAKENALVFVTAHKSVVAESDGILAACGFTDCPYTGERTGETLCAELSAKEEKILRALKENEYAVYAMKDKIRFLKIYCDYLSFALEKEESADKLRATQTTFLLQAYVPQAAEQTVREAISETSEATYMEFSDPSEEDTPPTLLCNNAVVSNFEGITNTYSTPNYREMDPNAVMAFFYSLFMGFIIGDMGYGLLMAIVGGWLWRKGRKRPSGLSRLAGAFAVGGAVAVLWGALCNCFFGCAIFGAENTVMPNPQTDMWTLAGISVPAVLLISMELGIAQLCAGYICRAVQAWRRGKIADGIFDGVIWAIFSVGVGLAIVGFVEEAHVPVLGTIGGVAAGASLLLAMLTAGRKEKLLGKLSKGFGAAYGIINYASDVLSYARLYGLMLSGAVIGGIIAQYSGQFIGSGNPALAVLGVVLLLVGHGFNLVISLLGAYIHDARLQYVEFYGRFYEGEGDLFKPLGSQHKYVYLLPENVKNAG